MRRILISNLVGILVVLISVQAFAQDSATDVTKKVQAFYKQTKDYHAQFTQTYNDVAAGSSKTTGGTVYFKKPGLMRWIYKDPKNPSATDKEYISDGSKFWVYEHEFKQVFKQCLKDSQLPSSLSFLMGQGNLLKTFKVSFSKNSTKEAPQLKLIPKKKTSMYKEVRFTLNPKTFQVDKTEIFDPYGNSNEIVFKDSKINKNLPVSGFAFKVPKSARVLNPQKQCP